MEKERLIHFDLLRILACISVVMLHSAAQFWYELPINSSDWLIMNTYNSIVRFGVPVFVAISGALFLTPSKEISIKKLYLHNILRLVIIYFLWSAVYGLFDCRDYIWSDLTVNDILIEIYAGRYHLWYLPMIVGIYMLIPILKKWLAGADKKDVEYFLILYLFFQIVKYTIMSLKTTEFFSFFWSAFETGMLDGCLGYFILGYYITHYGIEKMWHKWIYTGGFLGICANIFFSAWKSLQTGMPDGVIFDIYGMFTFFIVLALLLFTVEKLSKVRLSTRACGVVKEISASTFGVYLIHLICMEFLQEKGIHSMMVNPIVGVPLITIVCFVLCLICSSLLRRIPLIGRYIC